MIRKKFFIPKNESTRDYRDSYKSQGIIEATIEADIIGEDGWIEQ